MKSSGNTNQIEAEYRKRRDAVLVPISKNLETHIQTFMTGQTRIDRIVARAKGVESFVKKANTVEGGNPKYVEPFTQIQDQIGARIVVFYKSDVELVKTRVLDLFRAIEDKNYVPDKESEFGYFGHHFILDLPNDVIDAGMDKTLIPDFFELQIKTLFQHSWSEANHDLGYKSDDVILTSDQKRLIAFTSAQAWGADRIFDELFTELKAQ